MRWSRDFLLARFNARDARYDGRFLTGVLTTGIYCLPSCAARRPKPENVRFFESEDDARAAGLRPCLRCRPDRLEAGRDHELELVEELARELFARPGDFPDVASLARRAGVGATLLNELVRRHFHASTATWLQRARFERAARELTASTRRPLDVALDQGFESASSFHDAFRRRAGMGPAAYRRMARDSSFAIELPSDFRLTDALAALGRDPESPVERVHGSRARHALVLDGEPAVLELQLSAKRASCRVDAERALSSDAMVRAHAIAMRLLGLASDPAPFERRARRVPELRRLIRGRAGARIPHTAGAWEGFAWAVIGQQVHLAFASACRRAMVERFGVPVRGELIAHPGPAAIAELEVDDLARLRFSRRKAEYLIGAARSIRSGELDLEALRGASAVRAERTLLALRGVGPWSANYLMMRALAFEDCVPVGDSALVAALRRFFDLAERPDAQRTLALMEPFAPHRSLATYHLWKSLSEPA